jgi:hypothetical protein
MVQTRMLRRHTWIPASEVYFPGTVFLEKVYGNHSFKLLSHPLS